MINTEQNMTHTPQIEDNQAEITTQKTIQEKNLNTKNTTDPADPQKEEGQAGPPTPEETPRDPPTITQKKGQDPPIDQPEGLEPLLLKGTPPIPDPLIKEGVLDQVLKNDTEITIAIVGHDQ